MDGEEEQQCTPQVPCPYVMNKCKLEICEELRAGCMSDPIFSLKALGRSANVQPVQIHQWMKAYHQLKHRSITQRCNKWTLHHVCLSSFPQVKNLLTWVRDMRETGMAVSVNMAVIRASVIDSGLRPHGAQTAPAEKREEAKAWVVTVVPIPTQPNHH